MNWDADGFAGFLEIQQPQLVVAAIYIILKMHKHTVARRINIPKAVGELHIKRSVRDMVKNGRR